MGVRGLKMALPGVKETPRIILADLPPDDRERIIEYLVENKVDFKTGKPGAGNGEFFATVKLQKGGLQSDSRKPIGRSSLKLISDQAMLGGESGFGFKTIDAVSQMGNKSFASKTGT